MIYPLVEIGTLTNIRTGKLDANASSFDGKYPFFTCSRQTLKITNYSYDCDAILIAGNGDLNVKHYIGKFDAYQRTYIVEVSNVDKLDSRYLFHFMDKYVEKLRELSIGGVIKYIKLGMLKDAKIPLPPLPEQRRIAAILDKADAIRRKRQQAIRLTEEFLCSVFLDMFGDPVTNPKGWEVKPLGNVVGFVSGGTPSKSRAEYWSGDFPWVSPKDMKRLEISDAIDHISEITFEETSLKKIAPENILIVVRGMILAHTVPIAITKKAVAINQDIKALVPTEGLSPDFLLWNLKVMHNYVLSKVATAAHGTKRIEMSELEQLPVLCLDADLQHEFSNMVKQFSCMKKNVELCDAVGMDLFNSLVQRAFRGDL